MRLMKVFCLGVAALGLSAGASVWAGDDETPCPKCESGEGHGIFHRIRHKQHVHTQPMHVCAKCMKKLESQGPPTAVVMEGVQPGLCSTCQMAAIEASAPLILEGHAVGNPPGTVVVEGGQPGAVMTSAPGHAVVGEAAPTGEPEPIGVMRTNYTESSAAPAPTQAASGKAVVDTMEKAPKKGWRKQPKPDPANGSSAGRDLELEWSHLFLPRFGAIRQARKDAEKAAHAQVRYDDKQQQVTELPAKVVFSR